MSPVEVIVRKGDCPCPGTPHEDERVYLEPEIPLQVALTAFYAMREAGPNRSAQLGAIGASYFPLAIRAWTFTDSEHNLRKITRESVAELLPWHKGGYEVLNAADGLYGQDLLRPLLDLRSKSSPGGPTETSTSPSPASGSPLPTPLPRSSQNTQDGKRSAAPAP